MSPSPPWAAAAEILLGTIPDFGERYLAALQALDPDRRPEHGLGEMKRDLIEYGPPELRLRCRLGRSR